MVDAKCFTFTRGVAEADGAYWFRTVRTAGNVDAEWKVYGPSGASECSGFNYTPDQRCKLLAAGRYDLVVFDDSGERSGSFYLTSRRLNEPAGCSPLASVAFGEAPISGSISSGGETDCYSLTGLSDEDTLSISAQIASGGAPGWAVVNSSGDTACSSYYATRDVRCQLAGAEPWSLIVFDRSGPDTFSYSLAVRRLNEPEGCSSALGSPSTWSFTSPRVNSSLSGTFGADCFTFTRGEAEADGAYWFRVAPTSSEFEPHWTLYGPSGAQECNGSDNEPAGACRLLGLGTFTFVVDDQIDRSGSYYLTAKRLNEPAGCSSFSEFGFDDAATIGSISSAGEADCRTLSGASAGDRLLVGMTASGAVSGTPRWSLVDGNGYAICSSNYYGSLSANCALTGTPGWSLIVYGDRTATFSYSLAVRRLDNPEGCSSALGDPGSWSFTSPRLNGSLSGGLDAKCFTFTRGEADADGAYWFRTVRTAGSLDPAWSVYGPSGALECSDSNSNWVQTCKLSAPGTYSTVIGSANGEAGSFLLTAKRLNQPSGCAPVPVGAFGVRPTLGNLANAGEIDCYSLTAGSHDQLELMRSGAADALALVDSDGEVQCFGPGWCTVGNSGTYSLLAFSSDGTHTGGYQFEATCENVPCGETQTALTEVTPNRVGQGNSVTVLLRGHDLELLETIRLTRNSSVIEGEVQQPAPDGKTVDVRFDLTAAEIGAWNVEGSFIDGTTRTIAGGLHVEGPGDPIVSLQLTGREVFRTLHQVPVSLEVSNSGNVDALAVPVVLSGIPAGSTVDPQFSLVRPEGSLSSPTYTEKDFEPQTDALELEDGMALPMFIPRIPARSSVQLDFIVTVPSGGVSYLLKARAGQCLGNSGASAGTSAMAMTAETVDDSAVGPCAKEVGKSIAEQIPILGTGVSCLETGGDIGAALARGIVYPLLGIHGFKVVSAEDSLDFGMDVAGCAVPASGVSKLTKKFVDDAGLVGAANDSAAACYSLSAQAQLPQTRVTAIDPNELVGPSGVGPKHYVSGSQPLQYRVFFENEVGASAPAQRIEIDDQLDTSKFDPSSVLFNSIRFGHTSLVLPYASPTIDETLDLRPGENLQVRVEGGVTPQGKVRVVLQAIDPETLEPPTDPTVGILPPNLNAPEGEGALQFTVAADSPQSGSVLTNTAEIVFDDNPPISTEPWSNVIDKSSPTPTVAASSTSDPLAVDVSWGGSDDASGIDLWEIEISKDGGPFEFWRSSTAPGSNTYVAADPGTYGFRAVVHDGAGNSGQSAISSVTLAPGGSGGATGPPPAPAAASTAPSTSAAPTKTARPKCKRGYKRKKAKGRLRCVKGKRHHRR